MFQVVAAGRVAPFHLSVVANGARLRMEANTGTALSLISKAKYRWIWPVTVPKLTPTSIWLCTYTGEGLVIKGSTAVTVKYNGQKVRDSHLLVVQGNGPSLLGRNWLMRIKLDWRQLHSIRENALKPMSALSTILDQHKELFKDELGTIRGTTAKLHVDLAMPISKLYLMTLQRISLSSTPTRVSIDTIA